MAEDDGWMPVTGAPQEPSQSDGWAPVAGGPSTGGTLTVPNITMGSKQYDLDTARVGPPRAEQTAELAARNAAHAASLGLSEHALTEAKRQAGTSSDGYWEDYKKNREDLEAMSRLNPGTSALSTTGGVIGGMFVGGPFKALEVPGKVVGNAIKRMPSPFTPETTAKIADFVGAGTTGAVMGGTSSYVDDQDFQKAIGNAVVGAGFAPVAQSVVSRIVGKMRGYEDPLDAHGNWKPDAQKAIDDAFAPAIQAGTMTPADVKMLQPQLRDIFMQKGASEASAIEAQLREAGVKTPTAGQTTGERPMNEPGLYGTQSVMDARKAAPGNILDKLEQMVPTNTPTSPDVTARLLYQAERQAQANATSVYPIIASEPGFFGDVVTKNVMGNIDKALQQHGGIPSNLSSMPNSFPKTIEAYDYIQRTMQNPGTMPQLPGVALDAQTGKLVQTAMTDTTVSPASVMAVRKELSRLWGQASPNDRRGIDAIRQGFDRNTEDAVMRSMFSGDSLKVLAMMRSGDAEWSRYMKTFHGPDQVDKIVTKALEPFAQGQVDAGKIAQGILNSEFIDKKLGPTLYKKFEDVLGAGSPQMESVKNQLRSSLLNTGGANSHLAVASNIEKFLAPGNKTFATQLFTPAEQYQMRMAANAIRTIERQVIPSKEANEKLSKVLFEELGPTILKGTGAIAGMASGAYHGFGPEIGAALGYGASHVAGALTKLKDKAATARAAQREVSGAPAMPKRADDMVGMPNTDPQSLYPTQVPTDYGPRVPLFPAQDQERQGRKSGGRVSDRLVSAVDRAKKNINNQTQTLLRTPDNHVAQALEIANRNLES